MFAIYTEEWLMENYDWQLDKMIMMFVSDLWDQNKQIPQTRMSVFKKVKYNNIS